VKRHRRPTIVRAYSRIDVRLERRDVAVDDAHTLFGPEKIRRLDVAVENAARGEALETRGGFIRNPRERLDREGLPIEIARAAGRDIRYVQVSTATIRVNARPRPTCRQKSPHSSPICSPRFLMVAMPILPTASNARSGARRGTLRPTPMRRPPRESGAAFVNVTHTPDPEVLT
jgi:hypothetical protein